MPEFRKLVLDFISRIPRGCVASYGQVAAACGHPRAARQVGGILRALPEDSGIPWWRVINSRGLISIKGSWTASKQLQKALLLKEGVAVSQNFEVNINKHRYGKTQ
jgi:methylated-DNA-protein-cysteine methyltransferase-like protein